MRAGIDPRRRRGYGLLETAAAALMMVIAMTLTVQLLGWTLAQRRSADRRQWALQEATNALERLTAEPGGASLPRLDLSPGARLVLPEGRLDVQRTPSDRMARVRVEVRWSEGSGRPPEKVRLTAWVARRGRTRP